MASDQQLLDYVLRLADSDLILAQRLGEWVGHGPVLEEDIALTNVGLDLLGQARLWFAYAGEVEGRQVGSSWAMAPSLATPGCSRASTICGCIPARCSLPTTPIWRLPPRASPPTSARSCLPGAIVSPRCWTWRH